MQLGRRRVLALDVLLALGVGLASFAAARVATLGERFGDGPDGTFQGGPFQGGPFQGGPFQGGPQGRSEIPTSIPAGEVSWLIFPCLGLLVVALVGRRVRPRAAFAVVVVAVAGYLAAGGPYGPILLAPALALHALAIALPLARWVPLTVLLVPMMMPANWDRPYLGLLDASFYGVLVTALALMLVPALLGLLHRSRRASERAAREQELRRYAYEERLQIAREVHDVVGHSLSVINLQAGVALHVLGKRPDEVESSLQAIRKTSREALAELRTTLEVFREPSGDEPMAPRPGLARLEDLVAALRAAGREVTVEWTGALPGSAPAAVDQAAFRIVQEALTNIVRHAEGAGALVGVRQQPGRLELEIEDSGPPLTVPLVEGAGIRGMRERAEAVGGTLTVGLSPAGAVRVHAELPLPASAGLSE